jgi:hypothetical protein
MELLMRQYEDEMRRPITALVFGNLVTTMLIQVRACLPALCTELALSVCVHSVCNHALNHSLTYL